MKIALCLHGHFRCFDNCWEGLKANLLDRYDVDIFAQAWMDSTGNFLYPPNTVDPRNHPGYDLTSPPVSIDYIKSVIDRINPVDIHLDHYWLHDPKFQQMIHTYDAWHHPSIHHRPKGVLSLNYIRKICIEMKSRREQQQGWKYDWVICTRWDMAYGKPIILENFDPTLLTLHDIHGPELISETWGSGPSSLIDQWGQQFDGIDELVEKGTMNFGPHEWFKAWLDHKQIPYQQRQDIGVWINR